MVPENKNYVILFRAARAVAVFTAVITGSGCDVISNPFAPLEEIDPCDPAANTYSDKKHFIERDYLDEDGRIDYRKMFKNLDKRSSPCDPLHGKEPQMQQ